MPLSGDSAAAIGHRYEGRWTAHAMFEVLREDAQAIRLQPPGPEGEGIEFYLKYSNRIEFHQVKRQRTSHGDWKIRDLKDAGVLAAFLKHLAEPAAHCVFVSAHSASALEELSKNAQSALSWDEYKRDFLVTKSRREPFVELKAAWKLDDVVVFDALRRVRVEPVGEDPLRRLAESEAKTVVDGDQSKIVPTLVEIALDNVNHLLTPHDLWAQLAKYGYKPSMWRRPEQAAVHVNKANRRYVESRRATLIHGELVARTEAAQLEDALTSHRLVLLDGNAGMGKSDVLLQFAERLELAGTPYLAFRLDRATPTRRPEALGEELRLSAAPQTALAAVAQGRDAVLIIDQLDAVSATSGRNPQFLECIDEVVRDAHSCPNIRIVLVCRTFDMENDARLRQLRDLEKSHGRVTVGPLGREQLTAPLTRMGYSPSAFSAAQIELLRVPLHLALLAGGTTSSEKQLGFSTALDLFDAFWKQKRHEIDQLFATSSWADVVKALVTYMSDTQALRAPSAIVDTWEPYADAMISANVVTRDGAQLAFFHESFFDYAFARTFITRRESIRSLLSQDQFLFRRGQVRQILAHERSSPGNQYRQDLAYLLRDGSVRFHLKDVVVAWLSQVSPTADEWALLEPLLSDEKSPLFSRAWGTLTAVDWFKFADAAGFVERRLATEDRLTDRMVWVLATLGKALPQRVAEVLSPFIAIPRWWNRIGSVIGNADVSAARSLLELFFSWVDHWGSGDDTGHSASVFSHTAGEVAKVHPDWACELLGRFLENRIKIAQQAGLKSPLEIGADVIPHDLHLELFLGNLGGKSPAAFLDFVWPAMATIVEATSVELREELLRVDSTWSYRHLDEGFGDLKDTLLSAAEAAFGGIARIDPQRFSVLVDQYRQTDRDTVVYLLYEGFRGDPKRLADVGLEFLLDDLRRLRVGYSNDSYWATRRLLESLTPFASTALVGRLEQVLLEYYPDIRWSAGRAQFILLGGINPSRRSPAAQKRFAELQRKFERTDASPPEGVTGGAVRSPIAGDAAGKMSDEQWLRAVAKYSSEWGDRDNGSRDFLKGGAVELSRVLEDETKREPERFARLGLRFPDDSNEAYFGALLRGVANAAEQPPAETTYRLIRKCHELPSRPCGREIAEPLRKQAAADLPAEILDIVAWYAIHDKDPEADREAKAGPLDSVNEGLNTVRGSIAGAIADLIQGNPGRATSFDTALRSLMSDPVTAVRSMAAQIVCVLVSSSPDKALELFLELVKGPEDTLLTSYFVHLYLQWRGREDFETLKPIMLRMIQSVSPEVRKCGSAHMNLAALTLEEARAVADACLESQDEALRLGGAMVFKSNLRFEEHGARCAQVLERLFDDPSPEIRKMAGNAIWILTGTQLGSFVSLARAFLRSAAFAENADDLVHALKETTSAVPELILETCETALDAFEKNPKGSIAHQAGETVGIVLRAYADTDDSVAKNRALDLVDRALKLGIWGATQMLREHDRGWA